MPLPNRIHEVAFRSADAARYLGLSPFYLRNLRIADAKALREGKTPRGPKYRRASSQICVYLRADLDRWMRARERHAAKLIESKAGSKK